MRLKNFPVEVALLVFRLSIFSFFCVFLIGSDNLLGWAGLLLSVITIVCCNYRKMIPACHGIASGIWFGFGVGLFASEKYLLGVLMIAVSTVEFVLGWLGSEDAGRLSWN
jgi:hypothetical protein